MPMQPLFCSAQHAASQHQHTARTWSSAQLTSKSLLLSPSISKSLMLWALNATAGPVSCNQSREAQNYLQSFFQGLSREIANVWKPSKKYKVCSFFFLSRGNPGHLQLVAHRFLNRGLIWALSSERILIRRERRPGDLSHHSRKWLPFPLLLPPPLPPPPPLPHPHPSTWPWYHASCASFSTLLFSICQPTWTPHSGRSSPHLCSTGACPAAEWLGGSVSATLPLH